MGSSENMVMPVSPMNGGNGGGNGWGDGNGWWIVLLLLFAANGWGNNSGGWGGGNGAMPYVIGQGFNADVQRGFDQSATMNALGNLQSAVTSGFGDAALGIASVNQNICQTGNSIQQSLCSGFAGTNAAITGAQNALAQQMYANQIADLNRSFDAQTAVTNGMNGLAMGLQNCCCENRASVADLKYTVATENCADRAALSDGIRDVIVNNTANTQRILDQLCQDKIDAKNDLIAQLRQELLYARGQDSQNVQTARILAGQTAEVGALYDRLSDCPVPTVPVYGRQPIFTCNNGCGCGGNNGGFGG